MNKLNNDVEIVRSNMAKAEEHGWTNAQLCCVNSLALIGCTDVRPIKGLNVAIGTKDKVIMKSRQRLDGSHDLTEFLGESSQAVAAATKAGYESPAAMRETQVEF